MVATTGRFLEKPLEVVTLRTQFVYKGAGFFNIFMTRL